MTDEQLLQRIAIDPNVMAGKPVIRGTRLTVDYILTLLAHGSTVNDIRSEYEGLTEKDIQACLLFGAKKVSGTNSRGLEGDIYEPSTEELQGAPRLVRYELKMLDAATAAREDPLRKRDKANAWVGSAFTDSALLHARNLCCFLIRKPSKKDDIVAGHFLRDAAGVPWRSENLGSVKSCMRDINKFRSHLTYSRLLPPKGKCPNRGWPIAEIRDEIKRAVREFITLLPDSQRAGWQ